MIHLTFIKVVYIVFLLLFVIVFISDYKTWSSVFTEPARLRKIRKELEKKEKSEL